MDFPSELLADLVPTFAEAMERVAKITMAAEENFMVVRNAMASKQVVL